MKVSEKKHEGILCKAMSARLTYGQHRKINEHCKKHQTTVSDYLRKLVSEIINPKNK